MTASPAISSDPDGSTAADWRALHASLEQPVRIYIDAGLAAAAKRIECSAGTRPVVAADGDYESVARLPRAPWRPLAADERALFCVPAPSQDLGRLVSVLDLAAGTDGADLASPRVLFKALRAACHLDGGYKVIGAIRSATNQQTTTRDHRINKYIGLHVDDWDEMALKDRDTSSNRISTNIGAADRFLMVLPVSVVDMLDVVRRRLGDDAAGEMTGTQIGRAFMALYPGMPVLRLRLRPGDAYVAPSENLVHDGSSLDQDQAWDEQFIVLGRIVVKGERGPTPEAEDPS